MASRGVLVLAVLLMALSCSAAASAALFKTPPAISCGTGP